jgi:hypothetical protein
MRWWRRSNARGSTSDLALPSRTPGVRKEAEIAKRLDQQDRRLARLERDVGIGVQTSAPS